MFSALHYSHAGPPSSVLSSFRTALSTPALLCVLPVISYLLFVHATLFSLYPFHSIFLPPILHIVDCYLFWHVPLASYFSRTHSLYFPVRITCHSPVVHTIISQTLWRPLLHFSFLNHSLLYLFSPFNIFTLINVFSSPCSAMHLPPLLFFVH